METEIVQENIVDYDKLLKELSVQLVNQSLPVVQGEVQGVLRPHFITGETEGSIQVRPVSQTQQPREGAAGEVYTNIEHAEVLEYTAVPFMRLGARRARKLVRALIKPIFGEAMRGAISLRKRRKH